MQTIATANPGTTITREQRDEQEARELAAIGDTLRPLGEARIRALCFAIIEAMLVRLMTFCSDKWYLAAAEELLALMIAGKLAPSGAESWEVIDYKGARGQLATVITLTWPELRRDVDRLASRCFCRAGEAGAWPLESQVLYDVATALRRSCEHGGLLTVFASLVVRDAKRLLAARGADVRRIDELVAQALAAPERPTFTPSETGAL